MKISSLTKLNLQSCVLLTDVGLATIMKNHPGLRRLGSRDFAVLSFTASDLFASCRCQLLPELDDRRLGEGRHGLPQTGAF